MAVPALEPISPLTSYFDVLGGVSISDADLSRRFRELSRRYHPDRFATADVETQMAAQDSTALLNDAYRTLKDPFLRAEYLLRRTRGTSVDDLKTQASPPPELLATVLELQENLMEYQEAQMDDDTDTASRLRPALLEAKVEFEAAYETMIETLRSLFVRYANPPDNDTAQREEALTQMAGILGQRGYLRRVLDNLRKTLETSSAPEPTA